MAKLLTLLPDDAWTIAYDQIVATLKADATLAAIIPPRQWTTYTEDESPAANVPGDVRGLPAIHMIPNGAPTNSETQTRQAAPLGIEVTLTTDGQDVRDLMNLWGAFQAAIFTGDGVKALGNAIRAALKAASEARGKSVGSLETINLGAPSFGSGTDNDNNPFLYAKGSIVAMMTVPK